MFDSNNCTFPFYFYDRNLANYPMICLDSGKEFLCKAIRYCHHILFTTVNGKFENFGCDLTENQHTIALNYTPSHDSTQKICISTGLFHVIETFAS